MMQRQHTTESVARHRKPSRKKGLRFDKLCIDDSIDEGYSSGNPSPFTTHYPKLDASSDTDAATPLESTMSKQKVRNNNWTAGNRDQKNNSTLEGENQPLAPEEQVSRPKMLQRIESRTFVFIYDEEEKKSKAVAAPDNLNVDLPVLLQYNLTEEAIEKCLEKPQLGNSPTEDNVETEDNMNIPVVAADKALALGGKFYSPTERLLQSREKDELKNKGMHVVKWLVNLDHSIEKPLTDS